MRCAPRNWPIGLRFHLVSAYAFAHGKTSNRKRLQRATYADVRSQFGLPSQMACNVPRQVSLRRDYGLKRCRDHGEVGMERCVGWGILASNLWYLGQACAKRASKAA